MRVGLKKRWGEREQEGETSFFLDFLFDFLIKQKVKARLAWGHRIYTKFNIDILSTTTIFTKLGVEPRILKNDALKKHH